MNQTNYHSNSQRYPLHQIAAGLVPVVLHLHDGNDPDGVRRERWAKAWAAQTGKPYYNAKKNYVTVALIKDLKQKDPKQTAPEFIYGFGVARCSPRDTVSRKNGHSIALGRAIANHVQGGPNPEAARALALPLWDDHASVLGCGSFL